MAKVDNLAAAICVQLTFHPLDFIFLIPIIVHCFDWIFFIFIVALNLFSQFSIFFFPSYPTTLNMVNMGIWSIREVI